MKIQFNKRDPVYIQVIDYFKEQISLGHIQAGEEIPSRRELANQLKINPNTAQRAYKEMEEAGLIFTERNQPSQITKDEKVLKMVRDELIEEAASAFVESMQRINVDFDETVQIVKETFKKAKKSKGESND